MAQDIAGKVAVVTGGASGIGRATVETFVRNGARVVFGDVQTKAGSELAASLGPDCLFVPTDVAREEDMRALAHTALDRFGRIDTLVNVAGFLGVKGPIGELDMAAFDRTVAVLFRGVVLGYKYCAPPMMDQRSGSIISIASTAGLQAGFGPWTYSALKAAIIHFARAAAPELGKHFVRSNTINPGGTATPMQGARFGLKPEEAHDLPPFMEPEWAKYQPIPRAGIPQDIADAALFLASDRSSFITGHALVVDGGLTAGPMGDPVAERMDFDGAFERYKAWKAGRVGG
ncbi:SDR family NAD(P)-dependent oxidoreductase [Niveispirillum sp.]|uniref:SDR family NAD(P)-dependent oxidoreductase n=1 Tax=Niveispirillum sp. TaxID=1917217 RepID=UPI001B70B8DF|nr:glucose 1-dehydrogenase [Niveispirillum sp.]MBP7336539.1 glucose 1-dehydrogenase [Niveispirillum sp.]